MTRPFAITWDYRCPFARNVHEHLLAGLASGADWDVTFLPFSLGQSHVELGQPSVWENPAQDSGILALQVGVVVRDKFPEQFLAVHGAFFDARHNQGLHIESRDVVTKLLVENGVDASAVFAEIDSGAALAKVQEQHEQYAISHDVWGVPTFVVGEYATFVRLMNRPKDTQSPHESIDAIERVVDLVGGWPELNEFKHTTLGR